MKKRGGASLGLSLSIAILAGGKSSRFGGIDKQEALLNGEELGRIAARKALAACGSVIVVGKNRRPYRGMPLSFTEDRLPGFGPLSGLHAALSAAGTDWVYLTACDMPFFSPRWLEYLISRVGEGSVQAVVAGSGSYIEPFHGLYSRELEGRLEAILSEPDSSPRRRSFSRLVSEVPHHLVPEALVREFSPDWSLFRSVNSPADLEALRSGYRTT